MTKPGGRHTCKNETRFVTFYTTQVFCIIRTWENTLSQSDRSRTWSFSYCAFLPLPAGVVHFKANCRKNRKLQNQLDCLATFLSSFLSYFCVILLSQIVTLHSNFKVENQLFNVLRRSLPLTDRSFCSLESVGRLLIPGLVITPRGY